MSYSQQLVAERYRLTSQIGSGGMGRVWLARDEVLHRDVAVKEVMLPEELSDREREELFQRTLREARAAGRLNHPNVVGVYDVVQAEGRPWIVMELVRSRSLYQVVKEDGPLPPKRTAEIGLAVLSALRAAHGAGVWHRDVKPGNVLLAEDGRVVLTDFGLATFEGDGTVTRSGVILGSAQYISPERARDGASGPESDMWSLGATLYAAVEGRSPFARETSMATLTALATAPPDTPRRAGPLRPVLIGLLRKNPRHRMGPAEVEKLLQRIVDGTVKVPSGRKAGRIPPQRAVGAAEEARFDAGVLVGGDPDWETPSGNGSRAVQQLRTVTEETFRHVGHPRRAWAIVGGLLAVVVALAVPAAIIVFDSHGQVVVASSPSSAPAGQTPSIAAVSAATEAMRVQACREQPLASETPLPVPQQADIARYGLLLNWSYYEDPSGFNLKVPMTLRSSRIGKLLCFRDPASLKTIAVYDHGELTGSPLDLVTQTDDWRTAAKLTDYQQLKLTDVHYTEGAADLEYSYVGPDGQMHGVNRMLRLKGHVYTVYFLTAEVSWPNDRAWADVCQPSFALNQ
jgi:hypothetical protein